MVSIDKLPNLSIIVAIAENNAIGKNNDLLCHISDDLKHFKSITSGHPVVMGRNTWNSLPRRPLPKRRNIVLTHDASFFENDVEVAHSIQQVFDLVSSEEESFIMGGAAIYKQFLPFASKLYITWIDKCFDADVFFPEIDFSLYSKISESERFYDEKSDVAFRYAEYTKNPSANSNNKLNVLKYS